MRSYQRETGETGYAQDEAAPTLSAALIPVLARTVEVGGGPPGLRNWVRAAVGGAGIDPSGGGANDRLVRDLARRLAGRVNRGGLRGTVAQEHRQTVRAERPGLEGRHPGETLVGQAPGEGDEP